MHRLPQHIFRSYSFLAHRGVDAVVFDGSLLMEMCQGLFLALRIGPSASGNVGRGSSLLHATSGCWKRVQAAAL